MTTLIAGTVGFIGAAVAGRLLREGAQVRGVDSPDDCCDANLRHARLKRLKALPGFTFERMNISDRDTVEQQTTVSPVMRASLIVVI